MDPIFSGYWQRKRLLETVPHFEHIQWWQTAGFSDLEERFWQELSVSNSILDVGAGDLRLMKKFVQRGYKGTYHTMDIGDEFEYTYSDLRQVGDARYDGIVCLDVIEHLPLPAGLELIRTLVSLLTTSGVLILQTPNARCIRSPYGWDMTHVQTYSLPDLWAYVASCGLTATGLRVTFVRSPRSITDRLRSLASQFLITRILGADFADNIVLIARAGAGSQ
jgi:hypothetical protein